MSFSAGFALLVLIALPVIGAPVRFNVVQEKSVLAARTDKAGILSAFGAGHKHGIIATGFSANLCADPQTLENASVSFRVPGGALQIDSGKARRAASLTGSGPGPKDVATIQQKMLSPANLSPEQHPEIQFESTSAQSKDNQIVLRGNLTIRGRTNPVTVLLNVTSGGDSYQFRGEFPIRLTDYGIKPESIGGVVKVADQVSILIDVLAVPTREACK
jgi:hypothetical protein